MIYGLVAPGYDMAGVAVNQIIGNVEHVMPDDIDMSTKLKLIGVREITNNFADNSVLVSNCYLEAIYKVKLLDSQSDAPLPLRRQSGSSELRPKLLDTGDEPLHIFGGHRNKSKKRGKSKKRNSKKRRKNGQKNGQKSGRKNGRKNGQKSRRKSRRK